MKKYLIFLLLFITCSGENTNLDVNESSEKITSTSNVVAEETDIEKKDSQEISEDNEIVKALQEASEEAKKCINDKWPNGVKTTLGGYTPNDNEMGLIYDCLDSTGDDNFAMEKQGRDEEWRGMWEGKCEGTGPVMFNNSPMNIEDINFLMPYGQIVGGHITPIDHMYFYSLEGEGGREAYEVFAIQDAFIFNIETRDIGVESQQKQETDYRLDMVHTCTFGSYFDLVTKLSPELEKKWKENRNQYGDFTGAYVKAGEVIGYVGEQSLDFGVYNYNNPLDFINPEAYESLEPWKIYTDDPFLYFPDDIRGNLLKKMMRRVEPRIGKINYDVDGTLSGNWFEVGTNFYEGIDRSKYWDGHLSFSLNDIDPTYWQIGIGFLEVYKNTFIIQGDPTPLEVKVGSGKQIYELFNFRMFVENNPEKDWFREPYEENDVLSIALGNAVEGYVMLELIDTRLLQLEIFFNVEREEINDFTNQSRTYER